MPKDTFFNLQKDKQEKIMRETVKEFINKGFDKGNIGVIAGNAGVAKGSMYQYFENKRELFLFAVKWSVELLMNKYGRFMVTDNKDINIFDFLYLSSKELWAQLKVEREIVIFIQDVFLGRFGGLTDESMAYMMKVSNESTLKLIRDGKENGFIRKDIDDNTLLLFITGVSLSFKEYIMKRARTAGEDIVDENFEEIGRELEGMIELLKNGMEG